MLMRPLVNVMKLVNFGEKCCTQYSDSKWWYGRVDDGGSAFKVSGLSL
jgi:hypothetical protein